MVRSIARMMLGMAGLAALGSAGCAGSYDLITSQRFRERPFHVIFSADDPIEILETVETGDERVRAMHDVREPRTHGGSAADQDKLIGILQTGATTDTRPLCRLASVEALSRFEDPRAVGILIAAYRTAALDAPPERGVAPASYVPATSAFAPDTVTAIQCLVLESLGKQRHPDGLRLLCEVVRAPGEIKVKAAVELAGGPLGPETTGGNETDRVDVRLAAIRSLGNYEGERTAAEALIAVLQRDKDVAVRGRAHESLTKITGQDLPPDGTAWANWLAKDGKMRSPGLFR